MIKGSLLLSAYTVKLLRSKKLSPVLGPLVDVINRAEFLSIDSGVSILWRGIEICLSQYELKVAVNTVWSAVQTVNTIAY